MPQFRSVPRRSLTTVLALVVLAAWIAAPTHAQRERGRATPEACALLDTPTRNAMDGLLFALAVSCDRMDLLGGVEAPEATAVPGEGSGPVDIQVNDSTGESGTSTTQSETSLTVSGSTGTMCSGWNDSWEFFGPSNCGFTGVGRSIDGGATWDDLGGVGGGGRLQPRRRSQPPLARQR